MQPENEVSVTPVSVQTAMSSSGSGRKEVMGYKCVSLFMRMVFLEAGALDFVNVDNDQLEVVRTREMLQQSLSKHGGKAAFGFRRGQKLLEGHGELHL